MTAPARILVVDDTPANVKLLGDLLQAFIWDHDRTVEETFTLRGHLARMVERRELSALLAALTVYGVYHASIMVQSTFRRQRGLGPHPWRGRGLDGRLAHLLLVPNPAHHPAGDFTLEGGVVGNAPSPRYTYAGIAVLSPRLVAGVRPGDKVLSNCFTLAPVPGAIAHAGAARCQPMKKPRGSAA